MKLANISLKLRSLPFPFHRGSPKESQASVFAVEGRI
jgi:hypothetical protein